MIHRFEMEDFIARQDYNGSQIVHCMFEIEDFIAQGD